MHAFGPFSALISHRESISFIGAYNGRPIISLLSLSTTDGHTYDGAQVDITITADGHTISETWSRQVEQLGPRRLTWTDEDFADLRLDSNLLLQLTERRHAQLHVIVRQGDRVVGELVRPIDVLAPDSWVAGWPLDDYVVDLAALVQPHEPALRPVLADAGVRLQNRVGTNALSGYQSASNGDFAQVDAMVESIYEAVAALGIQYSNPPVSWDLDDSVDRQGQRVRLPGQVLSERVGTCLDTSVLMASLLAAAGLFPVLLLSHDHAFVGYWRNPQGPRRNPTTWPLADAGNRVDSGELVPIESTSVTTGASYRDALVEARSRFISYADITDPRLIRECAAVEISTAHRRGTIPLPVRRIQADGSVELVEYRPQEITIELLDRAIQAEASTSVGLQSADAPRRVKRWMDSLLDLSLRNPLLNYRFPQSSSVSLMAPEGYLGRIEDLLQLGTTISLHPNPYERGGGLTARRTVQANDTEQAAKMLITQQALCTSLTADVFASRLRRMHSTARSMLDESGTNQLFLALGMVSWRPEGRSDSCSAPLILVPVNLKPRNRYREFELEIDTGSQITPNFSLAERLKGDARLSLDKLVEPDLDDAGIDIDGLIAYVRAEFTRAGLSDYRVDESATLGFFDFSTYRLWRDVKENWPRFIANSPLVKHLVETPNLAFDEPSAAASVVDLDDFAAALPVLADASQAQAVLDAMDGKTFVLQGPPGTGKSQTITNLLARALHSGKRVLFVAEKPDALAVVRDRLEKVGLGSFGLNLHDKGMRAADVRRQLSDALNATAQADRVGFGTAERNIGRTIAPLRRYVERLHTAGRLGESAYSARNKLLALGDGAALPVPSAFVSSADQEVLAAVRAALGDVLEAGTSAGIAGENPWSFSRLLPGQLTTPLIERLAVLSRSVLEHYRYLQSHPTSASLLSEATSIQELQALAPFAHTTIDVALVDRSAAEVAVRARQYIRQSIDGFDTSRLFAGAVPESLAAPVAALGAAADAAFASSFFGRKKRVRAVCEQVRPFVAPHLVVDAENVRTTITALSELQRSTAEYCGYVAQTPGVVLPQGFNLLDPAHRAAIISRLAELDRDVALAAEDGTASRRRLRAALAVGNADVGRSLGVLGVSLAEIWSLVSASDASTSMWVSGRTPMSSLQRSIDRWSTDLNERDGIQLRRWARIREILSVLDAAGLADAGATVAAGAVAFGDADEAFERGLLAAILRRQIEDESLDAFDGDQHDALARSFTASAESLRSLSPGVLAEDMISSRGFDAGVTVGAVGELRRELAKQRQTKPIRRLLRDHWHVVSRVTPLVLAIPDALVRFIDGDLESFDLVVFDEASQIRTAHAIGVLGRGRSAVVVGDDKQMPPTSIAQVRAEADESLDGEEDEDFEQESILSEAVQARVPQISLTWHYRSEDESLIAFSNERYYDSALSTLPSPRKKEPGKGLSFVRVDGRFRRQRGRNADDAADAGAGGASEPGTNVREAEEIVREIIRRLHDANESRHSIGVVTFNRPQQRLVQALLLASEDPVVLAAIDREQTPEPVTVWNLETVQGSERDVMLFSIAFSKDENGRLSRNFGPLNNLGGQRRLNVAVTRARRQVIVFCSFDPEDLRSEGLAEGLQHLERYLLVARDGVESDGSLSTSRPSSPDRHGDEIVEALRARGLRVAANVGLSDFKVDIAVARPEVDSWSVGLLTDGPAWSRRKTVGDRDSLPLALLGTRMGWPRVARVWTPDWLRDPDAVVERVLALVAEAEADSVNRTATDGSADDGVMAALASASTFASADPEAAGTEPSGSVPRATTVVSSPTHPAPAQFTQIPEWEEWYPTAFGPTHILEQLWDARTQQYLRAAVAQIIEVEGPVKAERGARHLGRMHGLERVREARVQALIDAVAPGFATSPDGFWFAAGSDPDGYRGWARSESAVRNIDEISLIEISNAMHAVALVGLGASRDEIVSGAAAALGFQRRTAKVRERVESALEVGLRRGVLREQNGYVVAAS